MTLGANLMLGSRRGSSECARWFFPGSGRFWWLLPFKLELWLPWRNTLRSGTQMVGFALWTTRCRWTIHSLMQLNIEQGAQKMELFVFKVPGAGPAIYRWSTTIGDVSQAASVKQNERSSTEASLKDYENPASCTWGSRDWNMVWKLSLLSKSCAAMTVSVLGENSNHLAQGWGRVRKVCWVYFWFLKEESLEVLEVCIVFYQSCAKQPQGEFCQILLDPPPNPFLLCTAIFMHREHISCVANLMELLE